MTDDLDRRIGQMVEEMASAAPTGTGWDWDDWRARTPARRPSRPWIVPVLAAALVAVALGTVALVAARSGDDNSEQVQAASTAPTDEATSVPAAPTTGQPSPSSAATAPTTAPPAGDLDGAVYVTYGFDGLFADTGPLDTTIEPVLGERGLARAVDGSVVYLDGGAGWWWWPFDSESRIPVPVSSPPGVGIMDAVPTQPSPPFGRDSMTAANGLTARVDGPVVTRYDETGLIDDVMRPARLVVERDGEPLVDVRIGGPAEMLAAIADFDGRRLLVARFPEEPAMPEVTYYLVDLAVPAFKVVFRGPALQAVLVGPDDDWQGPVVEPRLDTCPTWDATLETPAVPPDLPSRVVGAWVRLVLGLATCDLTAVSPAAAPPNGPPAWDVIDRALRQAPTIVDAPTGQRIYRFPDPETGFAVEIDAATGAPTGRS